MIETADEAPSGPLEYRYSREGKKHDLAVAALGGGLAGALLFAGLRIRFGEVIGILHLLAAAAIGMVPIVLVLGLWRWGAWARLDDASVAVGTGPGGASASIPWAEVEEIVLLQKGTELRGRGSRIWLPSHLEGPEPLQKEAIRRAWKPILGRLRGQASRGEVLGFGGEATAGEILTAIGLPLFLVAPLVLGSLLQALASMRKGAWDAFGGELFAVVLLGALMILVWKSSWETWKWARRVVELSPSGLHFPGPGWFGRLSWDEFERLDDPSARVFKLRRGGAVRIPSSVPNGIVLEQLIRDRLST